MVSVSLLESRWERGAAGGSARSAPRADSRSPAARHRAEHAHVAQCRHVHSCHATAQLFINH